MKVLIGIILIYLAIAHFVYEIVGRINDVEFKYILKFDLFVIIIAIGSYLILN